MQGRSELFALPQRYQVRKGDARQGYVESCHPRGGSSLYQYPRANALEEAVKTHNEPACATLGHPQELFAPTKS